MEIVALVTGIMGLVSMSMLAVVRSPAPLFIGLALGVVAIVTGVMSRSQRTGKAGLVLGLIGVVGLGAFFFLFLGRTTVQVSPAVISSPVAVPEAASAR